MLKTLFTEADIKEIYDNIVIYSILKYQTLDENIQEFWKEKYFHARKMLIKRNIDLEDLKYIDLKKIEQSLITYQTIYNTNLETNKDIIEEVGVEIENLISNTIALYQDWMTKISILFDFLTKYLTYSEDYVNYCLRTPPMNDRSLPITLGFDFKNQIPVDSSISGLLVIGQGICNDIANLLADLGRKSGLNIEVIFADYQGHSHSLNKITLENGQSYLIDATRLIRGDMTKEQCFLVSEENLNKNSNYEFRTSLKTSHYTDQVPETEQYAEMLIEQIEQTKSSISDLNIKRK